MIFRETKIPDPHNDYIVSVYTIECANPTEHRFFVPDGNLELMIANQPISIFSNNIPFLCNCDQVFWGQKRFTGTIEATRALTVMGIKFQPWLSPIIKNRKSIDLVDSVWPLGEVFSRALIEKVRAFFAGWDYSYPMYSAVEDLSQAISNEFESNLLIKPNFKDLLHALRAKNGICSISDLQKIYKQSARTLAYDFDKYIGIKPKEYQNILRFRKSCMALKASKNIIHTAIDFGYYDQAHFTNHFVKYCSKSPSVFLNEKDLLLSTA